MEEVSPESPSETPPKRRLLPLVVLGVVAATVGGIVAVRALSSSPDAQSASPGNGATTTTPATRYVMCISDSDDDKDFCARQANDFAQRPQVTSEQQEQIKPTISQIDRAIGAVALRQDRPNAFCPSGPSTGPCRMPQPTSSPADVEAVRTELAKAGLAGSVVRIAGSTDPAPLGTMIYAVPAGDGCVIGHRKGPNGGGGHAVVGRLPDGTCLRNS